MGNSNENDSLREYGWHLDAPELLGILRDGVIIADAADNVVVGWNPAAEQIFGYPSEEAIGMSISKLAPERLRSRHQAGLARYAATGSGYFLEHHDPLELPAVTKSGEEIIVEFQLTPIRDRPNGRLYAAAIVRDVTERVRQAETQRQLQEATASHQRLEAIGELATGVAHDFSNLLMVIMNQIDLVVEGDALRPADRKSLKAVLEAVERGTSLSRQLLAFARKSIVSPSAVSLNDAIMAAARFMELTLGSEIHLRLELSEDIPRTMMDPGQVDQLLMNLALNARDAMPTGGTLTIGTDVRALPAQATSVEQTQLPSGSYVRVWVADTGVGMDEETRQRIFEPFFTTKTRERGTGMGLAMVYGAVNQAGGHIYCTSAPGRGTRFEILLPAAAVTSEASEQITDAVSVPLRSGNILLVDDDPALVNVVTQVLVRAGHRVSSASSAAEALHLAEEQGPFELLVSDVVMPGMNGVELAGRLKSSGMVGGVLLMSGYPEGALPVDAGPTEDQMILLQKPFPREHLLKHVADLLSKRNEAQEAVTAEAPAAEVDWRHR